MQVKANVRQRRQDRIKQIREQRGSVQAARQDRSESIREEARLREYRPDSLPETYMTDAYRPAELPDVFGADKPAEYRHPVYDPRLEDPEYVWKHRRELLGQPLPAAGSESPRMWMKPPGKRAVWVKLLLSAALFGLIFVMFRLNTPWALEGQRFVKAALTEEFQFSRVEAWYDSVFSGAPSFIPTFNGKKEGDPAEKVAAAGFVAPAQGTVAVAFTAQHPAVELKTAPAAQVKAADTGRVIFVGQKEGSGLTVIIQHANGYQTVYGLLAESSAAKNDWIEGGDPIGQASTEAESGRLYFAVSKNSQYVNPADVVKFE